MCVFQCIQLWCLRTGPQFMRLRWVHWVIGLWVRALDTGGPPTDQLCICGLMVGSLGASLPLFWVGTVCDMNLIGCEGQVNMPCKTTMASEKGPVSMIQQPSSDFLILRACWRPVGLAGPIGLETCRSEVLLWASAKEFLIFQHYHEGLFSLLF